VIPCTQPATWSWSTEAKPIPQSGKVFAFKPGDDIVQIKRLESRGEQIRIIDNSAIYQPFDLDYDQILIIGQVIWFARQLVTV
jgi:SOS-response transcriptional repressor LexA